jgi:5-methyltetrahydropteroyltriglutamate--homocysteine methyltransferase
VKELASRWGCSGKARENMKRSTDRIITTHVGSLPRSPQLIDAMAKIERGEMDERGAFERLVNDAVATVVRKQAELGIDVVDDGEVGKVGFITYINERLGGFEPLPVERKSTWDDTKEALAFPEFYEPISRAITASKSTPPGFGHLACVGPITYTGHARLARDLSRLREAMTGLDVTEAFVPSISPATVEYWQKNTYYKTEDEYLIALCDALHEEYKAIVDAGFLVQIDDPQLASQYMWEPDWTIEQSRKWAERRVEALNYALRGIPEDKIRHHTCHSIDMGPRTTDMELGDIMDIVLKVRAGAYSFEAANGRHEHEYALWDELRLPDGKLLIPGVITNASVVVEHPKLVADRITRFAQRVGRENVIAGADCGFATFAVTADIKPSIVWAKFSALVEGARIASRQLWT